MLLQLSRAVTGIGRERVIHSVRVRPLERTPSLLRLSRFETGLCWRSHGGAEDGTEDGEEDPTLEASMKDWFIQPSSNIVHFYNEVDAMGFPIPLCRCNKETFARPPRDMGTGYVLLHALGLQVHRECLRKVSEEVQTLFSSPPP